MTEVTYSLVDTLTGTNITGLTAPCLRVELFRIGLTNTDPTKVKVADWINLEGLINPIVANNTNHF